MHNDLKPGIVSTLIFTGLATYHTLREVWYPYPNMPHNPKDSDFISKFIFCVDCLQCYSFFSVCNGREDPNCSNQFYFIDYRTSDHGKYFGGFDIEAHGCKKR